MPRGPEKTKDYLMIILLGGTGYVGGAFLKYFQERGVAHKNLTRKELDYTDAVELKGFLKKHPVQFLINAAGFTGKPNVDACEDQKAETLFGNSVFPGRVRSVCEDLKLPWAQISSGCIYNGRRSDGKGFRENDEPNFSFRSNNCSFYSGSKALGEEVLVGAESCYILRLRIPFDSQPSPRNYLEKLMRYQTLLDAENSISHLDEFVHASFLLWEQKMNFGTYNITQPGSVTTRDVVRWILEIGKEREKREGRNPFPTEFSFFSDEDDFMDKAARTPRSNCVMDTSKIEATGIPLTPVEKKVRECLWRMNR